MLWSGSYISSAENDIDFVREACFLQLTWLGKYSSMALMPMFRGLDDMLEVDWLCFVVYLDDLLIR